MVQDFLADIINYKKSLLDSKKAFFNEWQPGVKHTRLQRYGVFKRAISKPGRLNLIAEIKKASPSKGLIRQDFDVLKLAGIYQQNGADALSVLTEDKYFMGKPAYIKQVTANAQLPVLMKDFFIDEVQLYEAYYYGASAVLLIVAILSDEKLKHMLRVAHQLDMDCLVEVHTQAELDRALKADAQIIGINNRDLRSFQVDMSVSQRLVPQVPQKRVTVVESGIREHDDVLRCRDLGVQAVLIGETFMRADDIAQQIRNLMNGEAA